MATRRIFSGWCAATSSISMPPSVEATIVTRPLIAVDQQRQIQFACDVATGLDIDPMHRPAGRPGLLGDQRMADHRLGGGPHLVDERASRTPPLPSGSSTKCPAPRPPAWICDFTTYTGPGVSRRPRRLLRGPGDVAVQHGDAVTLQQFLGLVFVDVHGVPYAGLADQLPGRLDQFPHRGAGLVEGGLLGRRSARSRRSSPRRRRRSPPARRRTGPSCRIRRSDSAAHGSTRFLSFR